MIETEHNNKAIGFVSTSFQVVFCKYVISSSIKPLPNTASAENGY